MKVTSTVNINPAVIRRITQEAVTALEQTAEALHKEVEDAQVMPFDNGDLQGVYTHIDCSESEHGKVSNVSISPYARRLYYHPEYEFQKDENPNAKGEWYEDWMEGGKNEDFVPETYAEKLREQGGL